MATNVPLTPDVHNYVSVKTPDSHLQQSHEAKAGVSSWSTRYRHIGNVAQALIFSSIVLFIAGQLIYFSASYDTIQSTFKSWWGVPKNAEKGNTKGHSEMVRPTFFLLFAVLPLFLSALLIEFLRHFNLRRISGHYMLQLALVLRRKPSAFGKVSYWSYGEWLFFLGVVLGNVFVFVRYYTTRIERIKSRSKTGTVSFESYLESIGLTFGFSCIFNMAFLLLPATRNCVWMEFFNISYANGIKYHRWFGVVTVLTALLHCVGYFWAWIREGEWIEQAMPCFGCNIDERTSYKRWVNVWGELALIIMLVISATSIPVVRRKLYNVFYYVHQLFILAIIFSVLHYLPILWWILPTFILYCFSRVVSMANASRPVEIAELTAISPELVKVVIKRSPGRDGHYRVGQFLYLNVPSISKLQWHAFTISSSPRTNATTVTVVLKSLGDWTQQLVKYADECKQANVLPTVYVDGFYGASLEMYDEYSTICLCGGGIGVTPMFAILEDLAAKLANHETLKQKVVFLFSFRELALLEEIHPVLMRLKELDPTGQYFKTHFYLTRLPDDALLDTKLDTERLQGKAIQPTMYAGSVKPSPFFEPLRSRSYKALAMTTVFLGAVLLTIYMEFGGTKLERLDGRLWPLQRGLEVIIVMLVACVVFFYVYAERLSKTKASLTKDVEMSMFQAVSTPATIMQSDVHTYRDLMSHYNVVVGERPNAKELISEVLAFHQDASVTTYGKPVVGVFVSGPEAMKRSVEYAVAEAGASHFDIHEEEFEL